MDDGDGGTAGGLTGGEAGGGAGEPWTEVTNVCGNRRHESVT